MQCFILILIYLFLLQISILVLNFEEISVGVRGDTTTISKCCTKMSGFYSVKYLGLFWNEVLA